MRVLPKRLFRSTEFFDRLLTEADDSRSSAITTS